MDLPENFPVERGFRRRGAHLSPIDVFSQVVFALALVLLVLSLVFPKPPVTARVPASSFVPFAICFAMLIGVWISHFVFFRRYGLHDQGTFMINACLLVALVFCVFPLKILFAAISSVLFHSDDSSRLASTVQINGRLVLYAIGFSLVFLLVTALFWNAWRQRDSLALNGIERLLTVSSIIDSLGLSAIGLLAALVALILPPHWAVYSALLYVLIVPWKAVNGFYFGRKARTLSKLVAAPTL